jgi:autotransporter-associated beta strand protein
MNRHLIALFALFSLILSAPAQVIIHEWRMGEDDPDPESVGLISETKDRVGTMHLSGTHPFYTGSQATYNGAMTVSPNSRFSARFRTSNKGLSAVVDASLVSSASFFMEFWINPGTYWANGYPLVRHGDAVTSGFGFVTSDASSSPWGGSMNMVEFKAPGVSQLFPLPRDMWTHVAVVNEGGVFQVWVNAGLFNGPANSSFSTYGAFDRFYIGAYEGEPANSIFTYIDHVRIGTFTPGTFSLSMLSFPVNTVGVGAGPAESVILSGVQDRAIASGLLVANELHQTTTYGGVISGAGHFQKAGTGVLTLNGASSYSGITNAWKGTLALGVNEALPNTTRLLVGVNAVFDMAGYSETVGSLDGWGDVSLGSGILTVGGNGESTVFRGSISGTGALVKSGGGTLQLAGTNTYSGSTTVQAGTLVLDAANATSGFILNGGTLDLNGVSRSTNSVEYAGGAVSNGTVTAGQVSVQSGTLSAGAGIQFPAAGIISLATGGVFDLAGGSTTLGMLSGTGSVQIGTGALTIGAGGASGTFSGSLGGSGVLNKTGSGTFTLAGVNSFTGVTNVLEGTLLMAAGSVFNTPGSDIVVASTGSGSLVMNGGSVTTRSVIIGHDGGTATVTLNGGTLTTTEIARWSLPSTIAFNGATLRALSNTSVLINGFTLGSAVIQSGGLVIDTNGFIVSTPAEFTGGGTLTKIGAGTLSLTGQFAHAGRTVVQAGTLSLSLANLADTGHVTIASGAVLNLAFTATDTVRSLTLEGVLHQSGVWGAIGSGAQHETALITGPGRLLIVDEVTSWLATNGLPGSGVAGDDDHDGQLNLLEYFSGTHPGQSDSARPVATLQPGGIQFAFDRRKGLDLVTSVVEWSDDLTTWSTAGVSAPSVIADQGSTERIQVTVPPGSGSGRFVRLRVTSP